MLHRVLRGVVALAVRKLPEAVLEPVGRQILWRAGFGYSQGGVETEVRALVALLGPRLGGGGEILDIGANTGEWAGHLASIRSDLRIHAFEPSSSAFEQLRQRFFSSESVTCHKVAVSRADGTGELFADRAGSGLGSLTRRRLDHVGIQFSSVERVKTTTLDSFCEKMGLAPIAIKIDVEGHELDVLTGARKTLSNVRVIQFEFGGANIDTRTFFQDFFYMLDPLGFKFWRSAPGGLIPVTRYSEREEIFLYRNYFAVRA